MPKIRGGKPKKLPLRRDSRANVRPIRPRRVWLLCFRERPGRPLQVLEIERR